METLKITNHAFRRYMARTGTPFSSTFGNDLRSKINGGKSISAKEAVELGFGLTRTEKGDRYILFHEERIKEDALAIVSKDNKVKTVMTLTMLGCVLSDKRRQRFEEKVERMKEHVSSM